MTASPPDLRLVLTGLKRGDTADPGRLPLGIPSRRPLRAAPAQGWLSHRERQPAQEADALEPQRHRIRRRQPSILTGLHGHSNPVERTALRMRAMETGNGVTRPVLSRVVGSRCQPHGVSGRIPQEAKAEGHASETLTGGR